LLAPGGWVVALVKPQFEAGRAEADKGAGVIRDPAIHRRILRELLAWLADMEAPKRDGDAAPERPGRLVTCGLVASPITGRDGNHEYLLWLRSDSVTSQDYGDDAKRDTIPPEATTRGDEREQRDGLDEAEIARVVAAAFHEKT
jgi:hypothetical protein